MLLGTLLSLANQCFKKKHNIQNNHKPESTLDGGFHPEVFIQIIPLHIWELLPLCMKKQPWLQSITNKRDSELPTFR